MSDPLVDQSTATGFQYSGEGTDVAELLALADTAVQPADLVPVTPLLAAAYGAR
jgi:hypothetical protein